MSQSRKCPNCGAAQSDDAREGLCADCLSKLASADQVSTLQVQGSNPESFSPPSNLSSNAGGAAGKSQPFGDYQLLGEIAQGGMGVVYKARQISLNRIVALKMIRADRLAREEDIRRFRTEAQAAAQLQHPNIVAIHEVGEVEGQHFYSMDFVAGQSLSQVAREKPLSPKQAALYVQKIAEAIHYAHQRGILHRDLKPSNVLIDENDEPRVADFGLAKLMAGDSEMTMSGTVMGSPSYMPPEQASGRSREVTVRSDVYSLGAILYDVLCGRPPFRAETTMETLRQVLEMEPVLPRVLNPRAPRDLETIVLKCLQKEPAKRYSSAEELADELARFIRGEPIHARPVNAVEKAWRWCKRKPALAASLAVIVLTFSAGFGGVLWQWRQSESHRRSAEHNLYVTDMNLSQQALKASNLGRARQLLERHRRNAGNRDLRNWEWRYLWEQSANDALFILGRHPGPVSSVSISADGKLIAAGGLNGSVKVWDIAARKEIIAIQDHGPPARVNFSPAENVLAANSSNGVVTVWDVISWRPKARLTQESEIQSIAFSPNGQLLAIFDREGALSVWDWVQTNRIHLITPRKPWRLGPHFGEVVFSFDGRWLALGADGIHIYEVATGTELFAFPKVKREITALAFSPDKKHLASAVGFGSSSVSIWDLGSLKEVRQLTNHQAWVSSLAFSSDGKMLVSGSADQTIRFWNPATWEQLSVLRGNLNEVWSIAFPPAGRLIASGARDGSIFGWSASPQRERVPFETLTGVRMAVYAPEGKMIATMGAADFSSDGSRLAIIRDVGTIAVLDSKSLTEAKGPLDQGTNNFALQYSPAGKFLAAGETGGLIKLLDPTTLSAQMRLQGHKFASFPLRFMAGDQRLITCDTRGFCKLWDLEHGREIKSWAVSSNFYSIAASPDGKLVVTGLRDGSLTFCETITGSVLESISAHLQAVNGVAFSPDGRLMLTGSAHGDAKLWNVASRKSIATLQGHLRAVDAAAFSRDGHRLVTSSGRSEAIKLWDLSTEQEVATLEANGEHFANIRFSPDGSALIAVSQAGTLHYWRAPSLNEIDAAQKRAIR